MKSTTTGRPVRNTCCVTVLAVCLLALLVMTYAPIEAPIFRPANITSISTAMKHLNAKPLLQADFDKQSHLNNKQTNITKPFVKHVRFLKVHKAGSTTMQNMLFRFGLRYDLNMLLPTSGNYLYYNGRSIPTPKSGHFDIFACHTIYSKKWFDSILPDDSVNIGIVREPLERMISAAYYYRDVYSVTYLKKIPTLNFIHELVQHPDVYERDIFSHTRNAMARDFGFNWARINKPGYIQAYIQSLDKDFSLIMIMERFDESLVLLKRLLNWSLIDIMYLRTNSHKHKSVELDSSEIKKFNSTCFVDNAIYGHFYTRFDERVKAEGSDFAEEVSNFNAALEKFKTFCEKGNAASLQIALTKWNDRVILPRTECKLMTKAELTFIGELRKRQARR